MQEDPNLVSVLRCLPGGDPPAPRHCMVLIVLPADDASAGRWLAAVAVEGGWRTSTGPCGSLCAEHCLLVWRVPGEVAEVTLQQEAQLFQLHASLSEDPSVHS